MCCIITCGQASLDQEFTSTQLILVLTRLALAQRTRAVWGTFADIQCTDALFGVTGISGYL